MGSMVVFIADDVNAGHKNHSTGNRSDQYANTQVVLNMLQKGDRNDLRVYQYLSEYASIQDC